MYIYGCSLLVKCKLVRTKINLIYGFYRQTKRYRPILFTFGMYRKLQVFSAITNQCLKDYTLAFQVFLMSWVIMTTSILIDQTIRDTMQTFEIVLLTGIILEVYTIGFLTGYRFPGQANEKSKVIKQIWKRHVIYSSTKGKQRKIEKTTIKSFQDIKIMFGSVNFYEKMTSLVIVNFVIEKSIRVMLLLSK